MSILWYTLLSVMNVSALLTTLMVVTNELSSYLLILSPLSLWISYRSLLVVSFAFQLYLAPYCSLGSYCSLAFQLASYGLAIVPVLAQGCASPYI
jgi:hypothetical protein